ncbi:unnamed protein product [Leptidea sinapis]|uniref:Dolichyl-diphosphooligosaccharide--protein glycosyltransferase subunit STT3A n=1 Tax=Leptidea sinapis TaxID=189913 RepID=A0A5E4QFK8_9NEOP|nr:unnamed protein product [Leptidea sinapis]
MTADVQSRAKMLHLSSDKQLTFIKLAVLSMAAILSFATRLFSVLRFESVIHEFDPYFNYRTTRFLTEEGFYKFHNWFDDRAWYPLGRIIGGDGIVSSWGGYVFLINLIPLHVLSLMLLGRFSNRVYVAYSTLYCVGTVSSWGGYVFLINLIPLHVLSLMLLGRFSNRVYVAYSTLYCVGTALGTFGLCQLYAFTQYLRERLSPQNFELLFNALLTTLVKYRHGLEGFTLCWIPHTPRIISLLLRRCQSTSRPPGPRSTLTFRCWCSSSPPDSTFASPSSPMPIYLSYSTVFSGVMVRLMLVLAPVMCILSGIAASSLLSLHVKDIEPKVEKHDKKKKHENNLVFRSEVGLLWNICNS